MPHALERAQFHLAAPVAVRVGLTGSRALSGEGVHGPPAALHGRNLGVSVERILGAGVADSRVRGPVEVDNRDSLGLVLAGAYSLTVSRSKIPGIGYRI